MSDFFGIYERSFGPDFCRDVISRFENDPRKVTGKVGDGQYRPDFKDTTEIDFVEVRQGWEDVINTANLRLARHLKDYMPQWVDAFRAVEVHHEGFRMVRYHPGQQFDWHSDNIGGSYTRVMTAIWYLNTVEEGGATEFKWAGRNVQAVEGRFLIYPVGWPFFHRDAAPVSGPKYIIMTQLHQKRRTAEPVQTAAKNGQQ
jgi:hypothetical protein